MDKEIAELHEWLSLPMEKQFNPTMNEKDLLSVHEWLNQLQQEINEDTKNGNQDRI